ncbi:CAP domain-containing protein [Natronoglycomyces albus]|uniref:CAP domain-containing protein n=1 Tax=Natronoglycomyces albus TaxID=2811108 RepID=A0A895XRP2_9ACTN|nr:CAP domain-containing protein [Natronoglycomyces albus]QSB06193.1 CAP domain-containing protein [Natronoglycomyces albus]
MTSPKFDSHATSDSPTSVAPPSAANAERRAENHRGRHRYHAGGPLRILAAVALSLALLGGAFTFWSLDGSAEQAGQNEDTGASIETQRSEVSFLPADPSSILDQDPDDPAEEEQEPTDEPTEAGNDSSGSNDSGGSGGTGGSGDDSSGSQLPANVQAVIDATNSERTAHGCSSVRNDERLTNAAMAHAKDMADNDYFSHTSADGRSPTDRAREHGFSGGVAENIAYGQPTAQAVLDAWMSSEGHRNNILNCNHTLIGVGAVANANGTIYWVQKFA